MRKRLISWSLLFLTIAPAGLSQVVSLGVQTGIPLIRPTGSGDESRPVLIGPTIEFRLPAGFAIQTGFLYQRVGNTSNYSIIQPTFITAVTNRQSGNSFEVPILGKYYFRPRRSGWQPFLGTGYAFRTIDMHSDVSEFSSNPNGLTNLR